MNEDIKKGLEDRNLDFMRDVLRDQRSSFRAIVITLICVVFLLATCLFVLGMYGTNRMMEFLDKAEFHTQVELTNTDSAVNNGDITIGKKDNV